MKWQFEREQAGVKEGGKVEEMEEMEKMGEMGKMGKMGKMEKMEKMEKMGKVEKMGKMGKTEEEMGEDGGEKVGGLKNPFGVLSTLRNGRVRDLKRRPV